MSLDKLKSYRVNKAFTEGVTIHLDDAPDVDFTVVLPGPYNRPYMAAMYGGIEVDFSDDGASRAKTNVLQARETQIVAFLEHCLRWIDGEPVPEDFRDEYPAAVDELMAKATELANRLDEEVDDAAGKLSPTSIGSVGGATG